MLAGHFGIAELGKGTRRDLPIVALVIAAYLPDLARAVLSVFTQRFDVLSHSIPMVAAMSLAMAAFWLLRGGSPAAAGVLALACLLHWPADLFTGCKPTTFNGPWIGFMAYRRPVDDLLVEGMIVVGGWLFARRRGFAISRIWLVIPLALQVAFLLSMYWGAEFFVGHHEWTWKPNESWVPKPQALETVNCRAPEITASASFH